MQRVCNIVSNDGVMRNVIGFKLAASILCALLITCTGVAAIASPVLDPSFGTHGLIRIGASSVLQNPPSSQPKDRIDSILFDETGRIVLAGFTTAGGQLDHLLSRIESNG